MEIGEREREMIEKQCAKRKGITSYRRPDGCLQHTLNLKEELKAGIKKQSGSNVQTQDSNMLAFRLSWLCTHSKMKHHLCIYKSKKTCGILMCKTHCMK
jgi:hypothetical protein